MKNKKPEPEGLLYPPLHGILVGGSLLSHSQLPTTST
jgi:hypothetical protein